MCSELPVHDLQAHIRAIDEWASGSLVGRHLGPCTLNPARWRNMWNNSFFEVLRLLGSPAKTWCPFVHKFRLIVAQCNVAALPIEVFWVLKSAYVLRMRKRYNSPSARTFADSMWHHILTVLYILPHKKAKSSIVHFARDKIGNNCAANPPPLFFAHSVHQNCTLLAVEWSFVS